MKRRYKKSKQNDPLPEEPKETKKSIPTKEILKQLNNKVQIDLLDKGQQTLLNYKFIIDSFEKAYKAFNNNDESTKEELLKVLNEVNKARIGQEKKYINAQKELKPIEKDSKSSEDLYNLKMKKLKDKKNIYEKIVEKAKKTEEERLNIPNIYKEKIEKLVKETEDFIHEKQDEVNNMSEERRALIDINKQYRDEIKKYYEEGEQLKEGFEQMFKEAQQAINMLEGGGNPLNKVLDMFKNNSGENMLFKSSQLKSTLETYQKQNKEIEDMKIKGRNEYERIKKEIDDKAHESILLCAENQELKNLINNADKEEAKKLMDERSKILQKLEMMQNLGRKYEEQIDELSQVKKKKKKNKHNKKNKKKKKDNACAHDHDHDHEHSHDHGHEHGHAEQPNVEDEEEKEEEDEEKEEEEKPKKINNSINQINQINQITFSDN